MQPYSEVFRCDDAGEHHERLQMVFNKHYVDLEYKAPHMPQMNGVYKHRIAVNLNGANVF